MTHDQHLAWVKERALAYLPNTESALASFSSDLSKHPETSHYMQGVLTQNVLSRIMHNPDHCRTFITEFPTLTAPPGTEVCDFCGAAEGPFVEFDAPRIELTWAAAISEDGWLACPVCAPLFRADEIHALADRSIRMTSEREGMPLKDLMRARQSVIDTYRKVCKQLKGGSSHGGVTPR